MLLFSDYTVIVYKKDKRTKKGERRVLYKDHTNVNKEMTEHTYKTTYLVRDGFRVEVHETYVTRKNLMSGKDIKERFDTPYYCSPSSETYWSQ